MRDHRRFLDIIKQANEFKHADEDKVGLRLVDDQPNPFELDFPTVATIADNDDLWDLEVPTEEVEVEEVSTVKPLKQVVVDLILDEEEAIEGYENAEEAVVANEEISEDEKDEILAVLDHIKEEEEEHIDELTELVETDESEVPEDVTDPVSKDEIEELEDLEVTEPTALVEDAEVKTWTCWYEGSDIGTVEAVTEEEAAKLMMSTYPEYQYNNTDWGVELADDESEDNFESEDLELKESKGSPNYVFIDLSGSSRAFKDALTAAAIADGHKRDKMLYFDDPSFTEATAAAKQGYNVFLYTKDDDYKFNSELEKFPNVKVKIVSNLQESREDIKYSRKEIADIVASMVTDLTDLLASKPLAEDLDLHFDSEEINRATAALRKESKKSTPWIKRVKD